MAITRSEFETARKVIENAIIRHGDLRTALLTVINKLEVEAINKSIKIVADYFVQTRHLKGETNQKKR